MPPTFTKSYNWIKDFLLCAISANAEKSLLTRPESDAVKGILIMLIVLGHNKYVMHGGMSNIYLYSFHVYAFFYLPFLYDFKSIGLRDLIVKNLKRLYIPFTFFFIILLVMSYWTGMRPSVLDVFTAYICGSQFALSKCFGFGSFLWFIPTMFSVMFYRWIYYNLGFRNRCVMLILSGLCLLGFSYMIPIYVKTWFYAPFCMTVGLSMVLPAVFLREIVSHYLRGSSIYIYFFILVIAMMIFYPVKNEYMFAYLTINRLICPCLIFSFLLSLKKYLSERTKIIEFGKLSFKIYLIHIFIYNILYWILDSISPNIYIGLVTYAICFLTTLYFSKISLLRYLFPR